MARGQPLGQFDAPEIWLHDNSLRWHFICSSVSQYCRLMIMHLGILGWPLIFTPEGIPPTTYQWMCIHCKERLILDLYWQKKLQQEPRSNKAAGKKSPSATSTSTAVGDFTHAPTGVDKFSTTKKKQLLADFAKADSMSKIE